MSQTRIDQIWAEIVRLEKQKGEGVSMQTQEQIDAQIKGLEDERAALEAAEQAAEKEEREQGKMVIVGTYMDTLAQMFEALLPSDTFRPLFGINDYEEKRAQFYQLSQAYTGEAIDAQHQQNEELLAAKDERIKSLNAQALMDRQQLDEANKHISSLELAVSEISREYDEAKAELADVIAKYERDRDIFAQKEASLVSERDEARQEATGYSLAVYDLQCELDAIKQPKEEAKPSAKVTDLIEQIKSKNDIAPDDFIARWNARQKDESVKVEVPEIKQQENQFRDEDPATESNSDQLPSAEASTPVAQGSQFPVIQAPEVNGATYEKVQLEDSQSASGGSSDETPATRAWVRAEIARAIAEVTGEKVA